MKIIFMGTPDFAVPALENLFNSHHEIICVYTQAPKAANRGMKIFKSKIQQFAESKNLKIHTPKTLKTEEEQIFLKNLNADIAVVAAYGMLLPKAVLEAPKFGCINIHPSLLPRWRGAAPIQRAVLEGDNKTGCCIMQMNEGLDTGDTILQETIPLEDTKTSSEMHAILANLGAEMLLKALEQIENRTYKITPQSEIGITYAKKITSEEEKIDFSKPVKEIYNKIRGLANYPCAYFYLEGVKYKILKADYEENNNISELGKIIDNQFYISCNGGIIKPTIIQKEGKKPMNIKEFLNGNKIETGKFID
jgi:methionyl-tRNA formyltransferase